MFFANRIGSDKIRVEFDWKSEWDSRNCQKPGRYWLNTLDIKLDEETDKLFTRKGLYIKNPVISIVTVVKNDADGLEKTILSVIGQKFSDYEYIIIGGDSTDGTNSIILKYEKYLKRIIIEKEI